MHSTAGRPAGAAAAASERTAAGPLCGPSLHACAHAQSPDRPQQAKSVYCCQHSEARPRSERWRLGAREDWRYADLRAAHPRDWWWLSFFAVYLIQARLLTGQPALAGDCLLMGSCGSVMHVHI